MIFVCLGAVFVATIVVCVFIRQENMRLLRVQMELECSHLLPVEIERLWEVVRHCYLNPRYNGGVARNIRPGR